MTEHSCPAATNTADILRGVRQLSVRLGLRGVGQAAEMFSLQEGRRCLAVSDGFLVGRESPDSTGSQETAAQMSPSGLIGIQRRVLPF